MNDAIPVVILHRDEPEFLHATIDALRQRTFAPHQLFVVDNASTLPQSAARLAELEADGVVVIRNRSNRWVLGFNAALDHPRFNREAPYYVFSDGDIVVPEADAAGHCWLTRLVELMDRYTCAGKIGLSLSLTNLAGRPELAHIADDERGYAGGPKIGELTVAPVDTTLAIYRKDAFVTRRFHFLPGHKSLLKPHYYSLRTPPDFCALHLGWNDYGKADKNVGDKIRCFARFGGQIDRYTLAQANAADRLYYLVLAPLHRGLWGIWLGMLWLNYFVRRFPRDMNEVQAAARHPGQPGSAAAK